ncbi:MAG: putative bifunctional diguanylate cyclase/phosphodiesterase [Burkholderiaceae bacterium]
MRVTSLRTRIALVFLALMLGVQLAGFVVIRASIDRNARAAVDTQLEVGARVFERLYTQNADTLMQAARILAADYGFREAVGSDDRETIDSALANHGARIGASLSMFWTVEPAPRASSGAALAPDALQWLTTVVRGAAQRDGAHGAVLLDGHLHQVVAVPVRAPLPIGWVVLGFSSDQGLATDLRALSTLHVSFLAADDARRPPQVLSSTLPDGEAALLRDHAAEVVERPNQAERLRASTGDWGTMAVPIVVQPGASAHAVLQRSIDEARAPYAPLQATLLGLTLVGLTVSAFGSVAVARRISRPLAILSGAAERLGAGDHATPVPALPDDEVGRLARTFDTMRERLAEREARIARLAYFDALTGLPNRISCAQQIETAIGSGAGSGVLLMLDLTRFKHVNDVLGHAVGDRALQAVAVRLQTVADRIGAPLARVGGDEFATWLDGMDLPGAMEMAAAITATLQAPVVLDEQSIDAGASIGLAAWPTHGTDADTLLARVEIAMYAAKRRRAGPLAYSPSLDDASPENLTLAGELRRAIERDELEIDFQPKVALADGSLAGAEALVRWRHPERGRIPPDRFLPFAEQTGAIRGITRWVLRRTVAQMSAWHDQGLVVAVAVNLSTRDLMDLELPQRVSEVLTANRIPPSLLTLEVTESAIMDDADRALQVLNALRALGVKLSIDDFGTGYSSLAYLKRLPVQELKIDRSFTRNMVSDADDATIVRSTVDLGHHLGLSVVAEGIEDEATAEALRAAGCDLGQGWHFAKPMAPDAFTTWALQRAAIWSTPRAPIAPHEPV